jgi:protein required for attachment to host cells
MAKLHVRNGAWVLICDGKKALILRNEGDAELLNLRRASVREQDNPATRDQGTDAPGKTHAPSGVRQGSIGETDWHTIEEQRFADTLAADLNKASMEHAFKDLIVVAPPKTLAELRREFSKDLQGKIAGELAKDLTHHTIPEIEKLLLAQGD